MQQMEPYHKDIDIINFLIRHIYMFACNLCNVEINCVVCDIWRCVAERPKYFNFLSFTFDGMINRSA